MVITVGIMMFAATPLANFINNNPTVVMLALGFLLMIGTTLVAEGFGVHVPKGYIYSGDGLLGAGRAAQHAGPAQTTGSQCRAGRSNAAAMNRFFPDPLIPALLATVVLATLFPATGAAAGYLSNVATAAVMLLFFLHGVKLPRENLVAALTHWRLHLLILGTTFVMFPLAGMGLMKLWPSLLPANLWAGVLFLCALPSTVQMSIALTSMAKGNVAASVTSAAASNLLGIALTPLIAGVLLHAQGGGAVPLSGNLESRAAAAAALRRSVTCCAPCSANWAARQKKLISWSDRLTIVLSVYSAFSAAVAGRHLVAGAHLHAADACCSCAPRCSPSPCCSRIYSTRACRHARRRLPQRTLRRLAQEPGEWRAHGARAVPLRRDRRDHPADHDLPPAAADGQRHHCTPTGETHTMIPYRKIPRFVPHEECPQGKTRTTGDAAARGQLHCRRRA